MTNMQKLPISRFFVGAFCLGACLVVARSAQAQGTYTVLHSFAGAPNDGAFANGELAPDAAGNLYGTTELGGVRNLGTIFKLDPAGSVTILYSFGTGPDDGYYPTGGLIRDAAGNLYGTTNAGGNNGGGSVFELDTTNKLKTLFSFGLAGTGGNPHSRLVTINGDLYGVAGGGGNPDCQSGPCGLIYKMTKSGTETVLYRFNGGADGAEPQGLFRDLEGNLYGVATSNGTPSGTVWKLDTSGMFSVLYTFTGGADGGEPRGRVIRDTSGNIHGVTAMGGDRVCNCGVVYSLDTSGDERVIHKFFGGGSGSEPVVGLLDVGGVLYGTTVAGGDLSCGSGTGCGVFSQVGKTGKYTVLHRFGGPAAGDGSNDAIGSLVRGADGSIYGATLWGGTGTNCSSGRTVGCGTIFKYTP